MPQIKDRIRRVIRKKEGSDTDTVIKTESESNSKTNLLSGNKVCTYENGAVQKTIGERRISLFWKK